jgi:hypothetical protein
MIIHLFSCQAFAPFKPMPHQSIVEPLKNSKRSWGSDEHILFCCSFSFAQIRQYNSVFLQIPFKSFARLYSILTLSHTRAEFLSRKAHFWWHCVYFSPGTETRISSRPGMIGGPIGIPDVKPQLITTPCKHFPPVKTTDGQKLIAPPVGDDHFSYNS